MKRRRVKITGIGPVTPAGIGRDAFWKGILEPVSRVSRIRKFPEEAGDFVAAEVKNFRPDDFLPDAVHKRLPRHTQFALAGTLLAIADAGLKPAELQGTDPLVMIGAALMDFGSINKLIDLSMRRGKVVGVPTAVPSILLSSINAEIAALIGGVVRPLSFQSACCAGIDAVGYAAQLIGDGQADIAICGGTECPLHFHPMMELKLAGLAGGNAERPERQSRPFDMWRTTGVIGEGACILVVEAEESPRPAYAYIDGYSFVADPPGEMCDGFRDAIRYAMANARVKIEDIDCINAWGPGHKKIDAAEAMALQEVFGPVLQSIPTVSLKGAIGNPFGAAGAIQLATAALALRHELIPPTVNWEYPDPACRLRLSQSVRSVGHRKTLVNAHGLSGNNACVVLSQ